MVEILEEIKETPKRQTQSRLGEVVDDIGEFVTDYFDIMGNIVTKGKFSRSPRPQKEPKKEIKPVLQKKPQSDPDDKPPPTRDF